jgi:RNA polymerase-binding transcription factor DksA
MSQEPLRYSKEDLAEFEVIINEKLNNARKEVAFIKETLSRRNDSGTDNTASSAKVLEDGADTAEKESLNQLASRQLKFIQQLENALIRIKNGSYGVCIATTQ